MIPIKETIEVVEKQFTDQRQTKIMLVWFWIEIIIMTIFVTGSTALFWKINTPIAIKFFITLMFGTVIYDIYATFVKVRYIFIKEG